jgi:hypothetical protein
MSGTHNLWRTWGKFFALHNSHEVKVKKTAFFAALTLVAATAASAEDAAMHGYFVHGINHRAPDFAARTAKVPTWTFAWSYAGRQYNAVFVGTAPSGGATTTVPVYLVPVKLTYGTTVADPTLADISGVSPVNRTLESPIFRSTVDFRAGGNVDMGKTQFIDAFQRSGLWGTVKAHTTYHVLFGTPKVLAKQSITVPAADGTVASAFGINAIIANINWFDPIAQGLLTTLKIPTNSLAIFITTQTYLSGTSDTSGCCIGGYHSYTGTQAYSHFTFITPPAGAGLAFSNDVSALSHELAEYVDDPLTTNTNVPALCGSQGNLNQIYEVGDPIEVDPNYGDYTYLVAGYSYHLQDEVTPTYFGAPASTSTAGQSFRGHKFSVCQNGG